MPYVTAAFLASLKLYSTLLCIMRADEYKPVSNMPCKNKTKPRQTLMAYFGPPPLIIVHCFIANLGEINLFQFQFQK